MENLTFGIEIELTGVTRRKAAGIIAAHFGTSAYYEGTAYKTYAAKDQQGRIWKAMRDSSIHASKKVNGQIESASDEYKTEVVSPILRYEDIKDLQEIVRSLRAAGAIANSSTGIHIHIGAERFTAKTLRNLANIMASKESLLKKALQILPARQTYCEPASQSFMNRLNREKPQTLEALKNIWYEGRPERSSYHYDNSRYRMLNLHSTFSKGTVEFRMFNSTTHAGKIKAYIQLCLAIASQALNTTKASCQKHETDNPKYAMRCWLLRLGLIGDEFKTARYHLLANLEGNSAWRHAA